LKNGAPLWINESTGIIVKYRIREILVEIEDFKLLKSVPGGAFSLSTESQWDDFSQPLDPDELEDCAMVGRDPVFVAKPAQLSLDGYLLNLRNGRMRRLPYTGITSMPGCFLPGRKEVIVSGCDIEGGVRLTKINLITGENTLLDYEGADGGVVMMPELSPDGRRIAAIQSMGNAGVVDLQIRVIDLGTLKSELIGNPSRIGGPFSWMPNGDGIILKRYGPTESLNAIEPRILCKLGLNGVVSDLRPGDWPVVLRKTERILFQDSGSDLWHTCKMDGTDSKLFGNGLKGYGTPAVSSDEKRILFAHYEKGQLPQLELFELGKSEGKRVVHANGFTGTPVWR